MKSSGLFRPRPVLFLLAALLSSSPLWAEAVPTTFTYQGHLADADGTPVSASLDMVFALYREASGGTAIWQESRSGVTVTAGFFQLELGLVESLADDLFVPPLYLGMTISGESEMIPRMRINSVPFARQAGGLLACPVGETNCNGQCADLQTDGLNCGQCGVHCAEGEFCVSGQCTNCKLQTFYRDNDEDGWGQCADSIQSCEPSGAYTATQCNDCDDSDPQVYPGAPEICDDGIDNSCNGLIDCEDPACPLGGSGGLTFCNGFCRNLATDVNHCGACGSSCNDDNECTIDQCIAGSCSNAPAVNGSPCSLGQCQDSICRLASCFDGVLNANETDIDCGGPDCAPCATGQACLINEDCQSGVCTDNVCE